MTARNLRARMTDAERKLWFGIKDRRFQNLKFRRQVPVGPYVADFLCFDLRLVVEVDGGQHAESVRDAERDRWFADNGFRTLRFWNNDVLSNLEGVLTVIAEGVGKTPHPTARFRSPPPSPTRGEGKKEIAR
ncbi:MAG: endonuclease domain-containing protein [Nitrobacter sp.]